MGWGYMANRRSLRNKSEQWISAGRSDGDAERDSEDVKNREQDGTFFKGMSPRNQDEMAAEDGERPDYESEAFEDANTEQKRIAELVSRYEGSLESGSEPGISTFDFGTQIKAGKKSWRSR